MQEIVQGLFEDLIRGLGWASLKILSVGRYKSAGGSSAELFEGALGLLILAALLGAIFYW
jgi:hypothetical protein